MGSKSLHKAGIEGFSDRTAFEQRLKKGKQISQHREDHPGIKFWNESKLNMSKADKTCLATMK